MKDLIEAATRPPFLDKVRGEISFRADAGTANAFKILPDTTYTGLLTEAGLNDWIWFHNSRGGVEYILASYVTIVSPLEQLAHAAEDE